jgi:putative PIN family toxin of toxin-antitoxin system
VEDVRLVLDTDAVVAAMRSPTGASAALLRAVRDKRVTMLLSVPLAMEYEAVCRWPQHRDEAGLSVRQVGILLDAVIAMAIPVATHFLWRPQLRDVNDEMVLETAVNGRANALVTFNVRDYGNIAAQFRVEVLLPREALARIQR